MMRANSIPTASFDVLYDTKNPNKENYMDLLTDSGLALLFFISIGLFGNIRNILFFPTQLPFD